MTVAEIIYAIEQAKEEGILPELAVASDVSLPTLYRILQKEKMGMQTFQKLNAYFEQDDE
tara:strand:+ start:7095 stop:7274 length:180 start_codon:yes stop_codon:yes gene_type:complete